MDDSQERNDGREMDVVERLQNVSEEIRSSGLPLKPTLARIYRTGDGMGIFPGV